MRAKQLLKLTINGEKREVAAYGTRTLLEVLREDLGLIGTKHGCDYISKTAKRSRSCSDPRRRRFKSDARRRGDRSLAKDEATANGAARRHRSTASHRASRRERFTGIRRHPRAEPHLRELERHPILLAKYPAVAEAAHSISSPPLKTMGTLGGNLCVDTRCFYYDQTYEWRQSIHFCLKKDGDTCWVAPGSPRCWAVSSTDLAPVMLALNARIHLLSKDGERTIEAAQMYNNDGIAILPSVPTRSLRPSIFPQLPETLRPSRSCGGAARSIFQSSMWRSGFVRRKTKKQSRRPAL
jgi:FAD binding domain in molybdopterin dehydrogenase